MFTTALEFAFSSKSHQEMAGVPPDYLVHYEGELLSFGRDKESWDIKAQERIKGQGARSAIADRLSTIWVLSLFLASVLGAFGIYEQLAEYLKKLPLEENSMKIGQVDGNLFSKLS